MAQWSHLSQTENKSLFFSEKQGRVSIWNNQSWMEFFFFLDGWDYFITLQLCLGFLFIGMPSIRIHTWEMLRCCIQGRLKKTVRNIWLRCKVIMWSQPLVLLVCHSWSEDWREAWLCPRQAFESRVELIMKNCVQTPDVFLTCRSTAVCIEFSLAHCSLLSKCVCFILFSHCLLQTGRISCWWRGLPLS